MTRMKIWERIIKVFTDIEVNDIAVKTIILPLSYLKIIEIEPFLFPIGFSIKKS